MDLGYGVMWAEEVIRAQDFLDSLRQIRSSSFGGENIVCDFWGGSSNELSNLFFIKTRQT